MPTAPTATTQTATTRADSALARCLEPVGAADFLAEHWERKPLVVERDEQGRFDDLLSIADVERLLSAGGFRYPAFRVVKAGAQIPLGQYTTDLSWRPTPFAGTADPERVAAAFADGATIVLQALHHNWLPLATFCRALEAELGHPVQANSYYTPRNSQGFAVHHDTHDVFVLQVSGEKRWLVYDPAFVLPLKHQRWSKELGEPGPVVLELTLRAGDTLYLPRGWLHEALTSETDSLHVTVGVVVYAWIDALRAALEECEQDIEFRRSVPADGEAGADLIGLLAERLRPEDVARRMRSRFVERRRPILDGQLEEMRSLESVDLDTLLERRPTVIHDLEGTTLVFEGKRVSLPDAAGVELAAIANGDGAFRPADLPGGLDADGRLVLVRRLIREGFLRRSAEGA